MNAINDSLKKKKKTSDAPAPAEPPEKPEAAVDPIEKARRALTAAF